MTRLTNRQLWAAASLYGDPTLAGAKEPGPRRHNAKPEQGVLNAVMQALRLHPKVAWIARMNSGAYKTPDGRFIRFGFPGCPDIIGQMKDGRIIMIECKADGGRVTEDQAFMVERCTQNNGVSGIARSIEDAIAIVEGR